MTPEGMLVGCSLFTYPGCLAGGHARDQRRWRIAAVANADCAVDWLLGNKLEDSLGMETRGFEIKVAKWRIRLPPVRWCRNMVADCWS